MDVSIIFDKKPKQWGLRGDPYLWDDLRAECMFPIDEITIEEFEIYLLNLFYEKTGKSIDYIDSIYIEKYAFGGMSSGHIHTTTWRTEFIPMLVKSLSDLKAK